MEGSLGGEVYAFSEVMDHMALLRVFFKPFAEMAPGTGVSAVEDVEQRLLVSRAENPADGSANHKCDVALLLSPMRASAFPPGTFRPLNGVVTRETSKRS